MSAFTVPALPGDWEFLDGAMALPEPPPVEPLACFVDRRCLVPRGEGGDVTFHGPPFGLAEVESPAAAERAWRARHAEELRQRGRRFREEVREGARAVLERHARREDVLPSLLGDARLLRIHEKLYRLLTLHEYARIFERAIAPGLFREIQALPTTCAPSDMLAVIARSIDDVDRKARSPLRNKMDCTRLLLEGVTHLPLYLEPAARLLDAYRVLLARSVMLAALSSDAGD